MSLEPVFTIGKNVEHKYVDTNPENTDAFSAVAILVYLPVPMTQI